MKRRYVRLVVGILLLTGAAIALAVSGGSPTGNQATGPQSLPHGPPAPKEQVRFLPTPNDYYALAWADAQTLPFFDRPYTRYLVTADVVSMRLNSLALHYVARGPGSWKPIPVANGHLLRVDLRGGPEGCYCPTERDLRDWIDTWEKLAFDPMFSLLVTRDTVNLIGKSVVLPKRTVKRTKLRTVAGEARIETRTVKHGGGRYVYPDDSGRVHAKLAAGEYVVDLRFKSAEKQIAEVVEEEVVGFADGEDTIHVPAQHLDPNTVNLLQSALFTQAPVVDGRYFRHRALRSIKDRAVDKDNDSNTFRDVFGGLYYEFAGVRLAKDVFGKDTKVTDLDLYFESLGIGNIKAGLTANKLFDQLTSDKRVAMFVSGVTTRPRAVKMFNTPQNGEGPSWGAITGDARRQDIGNGQSAMANLSNEVFQNQESLFPKNNGFPLQGLWGKNGDRADSVPSNVAPDTTIPGAWSRDLELGVGCIRCHGIFGDDGMRPLRNDVKTLLANGSLDILTDLSGGRTLSPDIVRRLRGLYGGDFRIQLLQSRDNLARVTLRATGPWPESQKNQADVCQIAAQRLADDFREYLYDNVDARAALLDMGIDVPQKKAARVLAKLLPPDRRADLGGFVLEDVNLAGLKAGFAILRYDWSLSQSFATERVLRTLETMKRDEFAKWAESLSD